MTSSPGDISGPEDNRACPSGRIRVLAGLCMLGLAIGGGWFFWHHSTNVSAPAIQFVDADPRVVQAIEDARAAVMKAPGSARPWGHLGMLLLAQGFVAESGVCFAEASRLDPHDGQWAYLHAQIVLIHDPQEGLLALERAVQLCSGIPAPQLMLGEVFLGRGRFDEAETCFRAVLEIDPENPRAELGLGRVFHARGDWQQSSDHLRRSAKRAPAVRATHAILAEVYQRLGDGNAAREELRRVSETTDDLSWPDPYVEVVERLKIGLHARLSLASGLLMQGRVQEASAIVEEAVRSRPDSYVAQLGYGRLLLQTSSPAAAEEAFREAVHLRPDSVETQSELAGVLQKQGRFREAADCYGNAVRLKPQHAPAHYNLAICLQQLGERPAALEAFRMAIKCKPDFAEAHRDLGDLLARNGESTVAADHLQNAVRLAPGDEKARKLLAETRAQTVRQGKQ